MPGSRIMSTTALAPSRIFVTGGCGYLGSVLVPILLESDHRVIVYDNFTYGSNGLQDLLSDQRLTVVEGDIMDKVKLSAAMREADVIVHLAAVVGYPVCDANPDRATAVNRDGTANVVECLTPHQRLVYASTGSSYGAVVGVCTEETPVAPLTLYGSTKAEGEILVRKAGGTALRFATLFGISSRMRLDLLVNSLAWQALQSKTIDLYENHFRRTFLHVRDAARAIVFVVRNSSILPGQTYNVGDETLNLTKLEVAQLIRKFIPELQIRSMEGQDKDKRDYEVSYAKIREMGYRTTISMEQGIMELVSGLPLLTPTDAAFARNHL